MGAEHPEKSGELDLGAVYSPGDELETELLRETVRSGITRRLSLRFAERACRIVKDGLEGAHASKLYVTSVYWTVTTLSTVGYGDIFASTIAERTYCILVSSSWRV